MTRTKKAKPVRVTLNLTEREIDIALDALRSVKSYSKLQGAIRNSTAERIARKTCKVLDHNWQDDSYGGPDHGDIDIHCTRCGLGVYHVLY
jgi:hypothetical protein